jgi:DNA-binding XRE family transcriptional regulator
VSLRLRTPAQLADWLGELRASDQPAADEVGAALVALMTAVQLPGPPLVAPAGTDDSVATDDLRAAVDMEYQYLLDDMQGIRRRLAETRDGELAARSLRLQQAVDQFRTTKEAAKARFTAADAVRRVEALLGDTGTGQDDAGASDRAVTDATEQLRALLAAARKLRRVIRAEARADEPSAAPPPEGADLLELRADPLGNDIRIVFAIEPPGTATLLAALEGPDAIANDSDRAMSSAAVLLETIRAEGWPPGNGEPDGGGQEFADASAVLAEFFPDRGDAIGAKAAALAASTVLADLRRKRGLTRAELAAFTGVNEYRLGLLEAGDLRHATLHELTACVRALGGTLEVTTLVGGDRTRLY